MRHTSLNTENGSDFIIIMTVIIIFTKLGHFKSPGGVI